MLSKKKMTRTVYRINLIGAGNVATHLAMAFRTAGHKVCGIVSNTQSHAECLRALVEAERSGTRLEDLEGADIFVIAVNDHALPALAARLARLPAARGALLLHTAGSVAISVFGSNEDVRAGVMYPLQTFSRTAPVDFTEVPLFIEALHESDGHILLELAQALSRNVLEMNSERRKRLHLAAVFANNFANHCFALAEDLLATEGINRKMILPLVDETARKLHRMPAAEGQTGPARRGDHEVTNSHCQLLRDAGREDLADFYAAMSAKIETFSRQKILTTTPNMINHDLTKIHAMVFDVDGVLSTNLVTLTTEGTEPVRTANIKDGYALQLAVKCGLKVAIITGGRSEAVLRRYHGLGIADVFMGAGVKIDIFKDWLAANDLRADEVMYMGDDIPDYEVMTCCGLPCAPADAASEIKKIATYVSHAKGGHGCVRDVVEQILRAQGHWMTSAKAFGW